jgi:hypothetical protein
MLIGSHVIAGLDPAIHGDSQHGHRVKPSPTALPGKRFFSYKSYRLRFCRSRQSRSCLRSINLPFCSGDGRGGAALSQLVMAHESGGNATLERHTEILSS